MTDKLTKKQLQAALNGLAAAHSRASKLRERISLHCLEVYGFDPADVDNDEFIDNCDGGSGDCAGMTAEKFDESMKRAIEISKK